MSETKFTPGPWHVLSTTGDVDACDRNIARTQQGGMVNFANANLIAAAPDLYAAVAKLMQCAPSPHDADLHFQDALELGATALAKARGEVA